MAADSAHGARTDDNRRPQSTEPWQTSAPGEGQMQGRAPGTASHVGRRPRVRAS